MLIKDQRPQLEGSTRSSSPLTARRQTDGRFAAAPERTVTFAHSKTRDLPALAATADILVAAVGRPEMVRGS